MIGQGLKMTTAYITSHNHTIAYVTYMRSSLIVVAVFFRSHLYTELFYKDLEGNFVILYLCKLKI